MITGALEDISNIIDSIIEIENLYGILLGKYNRLIANKMKACDLVICRCPSFSAYKASDIARRIEKPYLAESMGDPWDAYWNHGFMGRLIAPYMFWKMKKVVRNADYAIYVTTKYLQERYPCKNPSISASNVLISDIDERILKDRIEHIDAFDEKYVTLMTTAAVDVKYKGQQYVIKAIPKINKAGIRVKYLIVGEGNNGFLNEIAKKNGVSDQVEFTGKLPLEQVFHLLDLSDIYLQPSLQEGLPRSIIEAMSRGCACVGARTAGIPELLEDSAIVKRKSVSEIAAWVVGYSKLSKEERENIAKRNFSEARKYRADKLDETRRVYFEKIKEEVSVETEE